MPAGKVTALRAQVNDSQRVNVFIDGEFALGVSLNTISKEKVFVGKELTEEDYERIVASESADKALHAAMRSLEARPRSSSELRERLRRKEYAPEVIEQVLERLEGIGLVDDTAFARFWVENRQTYRPRGANALRNELRRKGVDRSITESVLDDDELVGDQEQQVMDLARKALRKYADAPDRMTFTRKLSGYLQRRGFTFDVIKPVIDTLWEEIRTAKDDESEHDSDL
jgi:regulatory protein